MGLACCACSRSVCALFDACGSGVNAQFVQQRAGRLVPNWSHHMLAPAMGKQATPLSRYGWSSNARNADAAVDIFITSRPLRFFTGVKSKHS